MARTSIGTAWLQIKPSLAGISKDVERELGGASAAGGATMRANLKGTFTGLGDNIRETFSGAFSRVVSTAKGLFATGLGGAIALLGSQVNSAFSRIDTLNNAPKMFSAMGYAVGDVSTVMSGLNTYLDGLPTSLDSAVRSTQELAASFGGVKQGERIFRAMNNAGLAFNATTDQVQNAITQLSQLSLDGPLDAETWNSLRDSGFSPVFAAMAKEAGVTVGALRDDFGGNGTKSVQDFLDQLIKLDDEGSAGMQSLASMARANTDGIATSFANLKTAVVRSVAEVVNQIPNFTQSIRGIGKAFEGTIKGTMRPEEAIELVGAFMEGVVGAFASVLKSLLPVVLGSLVKLVEIVASTIVDLLKDSKTVGDLVRGFVALFVAIASAATQIALAIIPLIPSIIEAITTELVKPENISTLSIGMGLLMAGAIAQTVGGNVLKMAGQTISGFFAKLVGGNAASTAAAEAMDKTGKAAKRLPKTFEFGESLSSFFKNIGATISGALQGILEPLKTLAGGTMDIITVVLKGAGEALAAFFTALASPKVLLGAVMFAAAAGAVALAILMIGGAIGAISPALKDFLDMVIIPLATFLLGAFVVALNTVSGVFSSAGATIALVITSITDGVSKIIRETTNLINSVGGMDWYRTGYNITRNFSAGLIDGLIDLLQDSLNNIVNSLINLPAIGDALKSIGLSKNPVNLKGLKLGRRAMGGSVFGPGSGTSDSIPMALSNGEFVIKAATAQKIGHSNLDYLNTTGELPSGPMGDIAIHINGYNKDPQELAREVSKVIARERARVMG